MHATVHKKLEAYTDSNIQTNYVVKLDYTHIQVKCYFIVQYQHDQTSWQRRLEIAISFLLPYISIEHRQTALWAREDLTAIRDIKGAAYTIIFSKYQIYQTKLN